MANRLTLPPTTSQHLAVWYDERLLADVTVLESSVFGWLFGLIRQWAVTIDQTVHLTRHAPDPGSEDGVVLLGHEFFHVVQQRELGWWRFLARYAWRWRPRHISDGTTHPLEAPAYARSAEIRASLDR